MPAGTYTITGSFDTGPLAGDLDDADAAAQFRLPRRDQLRADLRQPVFQRRGQLEHPRLHPGRANRLVKVGRRSHRRQAGVVPLAERLELARSLDVGDGVIAPSRRHGVRPDFGDTFLFDVEQAGFLRPGEPFV